MSSEELEGGDSIHTVIIYVERGGVSSVPPEIHYNLLCFFCIKGQVVFSTPLHQPLHLILIGRLVSSGYEPHRSRIIRKFDYCVGGGWEYSHVCRWHTGVASACSLGRTRIEHEGGGAVGANFNRLRPICKKIFYPGTGGGGEVQGSQLAHKDVRDDGIKGRAVVDEEHPYGSPRVFQCGMEGCGDGIIS